MNVIRVYVSLAHPIWAVVLSRLWKCTSKGFRHKSMSSFSFLAPYCLYFSSCAFNHSVRRKDSTLSRMCPARETLVLKWIGDRCFSKWDYSTYPWYPSLLCTLFVLWSRTPETGECIQQTGRSLSTHLTLRLKRSLKNECFMLAFYFCTGCESTVAVGLILTIEARILLSKKESLSERSNLWREMQC